MPIGVRTGPYGPHRSSLPVSDGLPGGPATLFVRGRGFGSADGPALDAALARVLVREVAHGRRAGVLRIYRPMLPTVAFGRRDTLLPGFGSAVRSARAAGFVPVVRAVGGRVVAFTEESVVVDHVCPDPDAAAGMEQRFRTYGRLWADVLGALGVDARVGEVPGEYCPGAHSVNAAGRSKLVGTAQRVVRGAWLFSAVGVLDGADVLRPLLERVHHDLALQFAPETVGSVRCAGADSAVDGVEKALVAAYADRFDLVPGVLGEDVRAAARARLDDHRR